MRLFASHAKNRARRSERGVHAASLHGLSDASVSRGFPGSGSGLKAALLGATSSRAFTMVEIAFCLGIIGFALVAIIGILPTGTNVQKENREETLISQDATYFMEAIRNGAQGITDLTDHVEKMYEPNGNVIPGNQHDTGQRIIGLLSRPGITRAEVWAISGPATAKGAKANDFGFKYLLSSEIVPVGNTIDLPPRGPSDPPADPLDVAALAYQTEHLHEIRLTFRWPVLGTSGKTGNGRAVFRSLVSGAYTLATNAQGTVYYYLLPRPVERTLP